MARLTVEQADRLAQERPPYPPPSDVPAERCPGPTGWHRPKPESWNRGDRESTCTWCQMPIWRNFGDPVWRDMTGHLIVDGVPMPVAPPPPPSIVIMADDGVELLRLTWADGRLDVTGDESRWTEGAARFVAEMRSLAPWPT